MSSPTKAKPKLALLMPKPDPTTLHNLHWGSADILSLTSPQSHSPFINDIFATTPTLFGHLQSPIMKLPSPIKELDQKETSFGFENPPPMLNHFETEITQQNQTVDTTIPMNPPNNTMLHHYQQPVQSHLYHWMNELHIPPPLPNPIQLYIPPQPNVSLDFAHIPISKRSIKTPNPPRRLPPFQRSKVQSGPPTIEEMEKQKVKIDLQNRLKMRMEGKQEKSGNESKEGSINDNSSDGKESLESLTLKRAKIAKGNSKRIDEKEEVSDSKIPKRLKVDEGAEIPGLQKQPLLATAVNITEEILENKHIGVAITVENKVTDTQNQSIPLNTQPRIPDNQPNFHHQFSFSLQPIPNHLPQKLHVGLSHDTANLWALRRTSVTNPIFSPESEEKSSPNNSISPTSQDTHHTAGNVTKSPPSNAYKEIQISPTLYGASFLYSFEGLGRDEEWTMESSSLTQIDHKI
ncbi:hypothetical protein HK098_006972 [Nowakowskiella sp. JEL0407]|nr:hypothetical protein HK098_006972 [Nowakowskiella sp. JEL0407]